MKQDNLSFEGTVTQELGNSMFKVMLDVVDSEDILCTISGKIRKNYIRILAGDRVQVEMSPYDLTKGRIVRRLDSKDSEIINPSNKPSKRKS